MRKAMRKKVWHCLAGNDGIIAVDCPVVVTEAASVAVYSSSSVTTAAIATNTATVCQVLMGVTCLWSCYTPYFVSKATQKILIPGGPKYSELSKIAYVAFQGKTPGVPSKCPSPTQAPSER